MLAELQSRSISMLYRAQGSNDVTIAGTDYPAVIATLRTGEPVVFGGAEQTLDCTCMIKQADYSGPPTVGMAVTLNSISYRVIGFREPIHGATWELDLIKA